MKLDRITITGVHLHSEGKHRVKVSLEVAGAGWVTVIDESVADVGGAISHICEPLGIQDAIDRRKH